MTNYAFRKTYSSPKRERLYYILFFLIWPFGALLSTLKSMKGKHFLFIYTLFCILFCWNMDVCDKTRYDDLSGIAGVFMYNDINTADFLDILDKYFSGHQDATREIYLYFMIWLTRLFSDNPHTFFALCSLPYLFFQIKCFKIIIDNPKFQNGWIGFLFIFLFMLPRDIITVQNPRFTTALWLSIYVIMKYYSGKGNYKTLLWLALTPIIHSSYWLFISIFFIGIFSKHFQSILMPLVYISIPFSYMSVNIVNTIDLSSILPSSASLNYWITSHLNIENQTPVSTGGSGFYWVSILFDFLRNTVYLIVPFLLWKKRDEINKNHKSLFSFYLYLFAIINFLQPIPVLGLRYMWFVRILSIYMLFLAYGNKAKKYLIMILIANSWYIYGRYYTGTVRSSVPKIIFYTPAPYIIHEYWGVDRMDIVELEGYSYH